MNLMASPTEVGADRIVRLAISSEFNDKTGVYLAEDKIKPHHNEAQIDKKRIKLRALTDKSLSSWLN